MRCQTILAMLTFVAQTVTLDREPISQDPRTLSTYHRILLCVSLLQAFVIFAQGVFAGSFLSGTDAAVSLHEIGGWTALALAFAQLLMLVIGAGRSYGLWLLISSVGIVMGEALQLGSGYGRFLQVHVPLAVLIVGGISWQILWIVTHPQFAARSVVENS